MGAILYGLTYQQVFPQLARLANFGNVTLPGVLQVNPFLFWGVFIVVVLFLFYLLERGLIRKDKLGEE